MKIHWCDFNDATKIRLHRYDFYAATSLMHRTWCRAQRRTKSETSCCAMMEGPVALICNAIRPTSFPLPPCLRVEHFKCHSFPLQRQCITEMVASGKRRHDRHQMTDIYSSNFDLVEKSKKYLTNKKLGNTIRSNINKN